MFVVLQKFNQIVGFFQLQKVQSLFRSKCLLCSTSIRDTYEESLSKTFEDIKKFLFLEPTKSNLEILCDKIDFSNIHSREYQILKLSRRNMLVQLLKRNREEYVEVTTKFTLRIPRNEFPNVQEIPMPQPKANTLPAFQEARIDSYSLISDCALPNVTFVESILDRFLIDIFRRFVQEEIKYKSTTPGIRGLLEEGRHYMLSAEGTPENQHTFVKKVLGRLLTPVLPPFYRIFMSGIIPSATNDDPKWLVRTTDWIRAQLPQSVQKELTPGRKFGPWFYAPFLTSVVTPPFLAFLVGPSRPNRRKDGKMGGLVVEKCKFLQESGCKGHFIFYSLHF